jgi:hypothetical protein
MNTDQQPYTPTSEDAELAERHEWLNLQMPSFIRGDEDLDAETMFDLSAIDKHSS